MKIKDEAVAGTVAGAAFVASAEHIVRVVATAGSSQWTALVYPVGIDGLIYVGISAMQRGKRGAGFVAITIGAAYSLAFNGQALGAFHMPRWLIAASMPVCMLAAFLIVHAGRKHSEPAGPVAVPEPAPAVVAAPVPVQREPETVPDADVAIVREAEHIVRDADARTRTVRRTAWDVDEAVRLIVSSPDATDADVAAKVGASAKSVQRTRRIVARIADGLADAEIVAAMGAGNASAGFVAKVREAMPV